MIQMIEGYKSGYCPKCGRDITEWGDNEIDGERVRFYFDCPNCGVSGQEVYYMEFDKVIAWEEVEV